MSFQEKYLKYKNKYIQLKNQMAGLRLEIAPREIFTLLGIPRFPLDFEDRARIMRHYISIGRADSDEPYYIPVLNATGLLLDHASDRRRLFYYLLLEKIAAASFIRNNDDLGPIADSLRTVGDVYIVDYLNVHGTIKTNEHLTDLQARNKFCQYLINNRTRNLYIICVRHGVDLERAFKNEIREYNRTHSHQLCRGDFDNILIVETYDTRTPDRGATDDLLFWFFAICFSNLLSDASERCNMNTGPGRNTQLFLITNDKQKILDNLHRGGMKNLYTELFDEPRIGIDLNGRRNNYIADMINHIIDAIRGGPIDAQNNQPLVFATSQPPLPPTDVIGLELANYCSNDTISINRNGSIHDVVYNINTQLIQGRPPCVIFFRKFVTLIKYLQNVYFNCETTTQNIGHNCSLNRDNVYYFITHGHL
jgi:hypothetical protein